MLIKNKKDLINLINDLGGFIQKRKTELFKLNKKITLDTDYWISDDYKTVQSYLKGYIKNHYSNSLINKIKPKGRILLILSYNEPFILSIIPILNALIIGNEVIIKPSRESGDFVKMIWQDSKIAEKYKLNFKIVSPKDRNETAELIKKVRAVYFFGSYKGAQNISKICGENYIEFYPEIETADPKVFNKKQSSIKDDVILTLRESFTHSGQTCQRIQGVFVEKKLYEEYVYLIKKEFVKLCRSNNLYKFISDEYIPARESMINELLSDIDKSEKNELVKINNLPLLVINPKRDSDFIKNAYFLPVLWVFPFSSKEELIDILNTRKFLLGINIQSNNKDFVDFIIKNTKFTRYTINTSHTNIRPREGWGGSWPSGFSGYKNWLEHFSDSFNILK